MNRGFTFDGALMFPFNAAHARSFIWKYALTFAIVGTVLTGLLLFLIRGVLFDFMDAMEALDSSAWRTWRRSSAPCSSFWFRSPPGWY